MANYLNAKEIEMEVRGIASKMPGGVITKYLAKYSVVHRQGWEPEIRPIRGEMRCTFLAAHRPNGAHVVCRYGDRNDEVYQGQIGLMHIWETCPTSLLGVFWAEYEKFADHTV